MLTLQRLDVYRCALADSAAKGFPAGRSALAEQLRRAAISVPLNIAEAAGRTGDADKKRHFAIARGSAMECAAILHAARPISRGRIC